MSDGPTDSTVEFAAVRRILEATFVTRNLDEAVEAVGGEHLSPADIRAYVAESERARRYFDRLARADRALEAADGDDTTLDHPVPTSGFERAFGDALFESTLDELAPHESEGADAVGSSQTGGGAKGGDIVSLLGGRARTFAAAAATVVALGVALLWFENSPPDEDEQFRARSAAEPPEDVPERSPRVEIFCVHRRGGDIDFEDASDTPGPELDCPVDAELKLAYDNPSARFEYAAFFGLDADGNRYWYGPSPAAEAPVSIEERTDTTVPIGETIRLDVNHSPGRVRIFGLFADRPVDYDQLATRLDQMPTGELADGTTLELGGAAVQTDRAILRIEEESNP